MLLNLRPHRRPAFASTDGWCCDTPRRMREALRSSTARGTMSHQPPVVRVRTATLEIACEVSGPERGTPVILLHGFPDDPRTWDRVVAHLSRAGYRTLSPYLRGYGPTRFLDEQ